MTRVLLLQFLILMLILPQNLPAQDAAKDPRVKGDIWYYDSWYEFPVRMLSFEELKALNSEEFIEKMKQTSLLFIVEDVKDWGSTPQERIVKNWPKEEDIPYLLSLVGSDEECGQIYTIFYSVVPESGEEKTTVGKIAFRLLDAIQKGELRTYGGWIDEETPTSHVIEWARAKADSMKAKK